MTFGILDTSYIKFPSHIDASYLRGLETRSGLAFTDLVGRIDAALGIVNAGSDALVAALSAPWTTAGTANGGRTSSMQAQKKSQYTVARPQLVERTAHMFAIDELDIAIGFTEDGLMEMSMEDFQAQVDAMREALELAFRRDALARFFSDAEVSVDPVNATSATSPGFAGSGTGGNVFAATYPDGSALPGGYSHYYRDTNANRVAVITTARNRLRKWRPGPFDLIGSQTFVDAIVADTANFVSSGSLLVRPALTAATTSLDPLRYIGAYLGDIRVWQPVMDYTEDVGAIFKSLGDFASGNPMVPKYDPKSPGQRSAFVRSREMFPLDQANAMWRYGWNVNNRTGAALIKIAASGDYAAPTITY